MNLWERLKYNQQIGLTAGGPGSGRHKIGDWVKHPTTGQRGVVDHVYHDNKTKDGGRLIQVDYNRRDGLKTNHRENTIEKSSDQKSGFVERPYENVKTYAGPGGKRVTIPED